MTPAEIVRARHLRLSRVVMSMLWVRLRVRVRVVI